MNGSVGGGQDSLRARYLETALGASHVLEISASVSRVADFIREHLGLETVHFSLYEGDPVAETVFSEIPTARHVVADDLRDLKTALEPEIARFSPAAASGGEHALRVLEASTSLVLAPLRTRSGQPVGVLLLGRGTADIAEQELVLAAGLAETLSLSMERTHYMDDSARRAFMERARADLANALLDCRRESDLYDLMLAYLETLYGLESATLMFRGADGGVAAELSLRLAAMRDQGRTYVLDGLQIEPTEALRRVLEEDKAGPTTFPVDRSLFARLEPADDTGGLAEPRKRLEEAFQQLRPNQAVVMRVPGLGFVLGALTQELPQMDVGALDMVLSAVAGKALEIRNDRLRRRSVLKVERVRELQIELRNVPMGEWRRKLEFIAHKTASLFERSLVTIYLTDRERRLTPVVRAGAGAGAITDRTLSFVDALARQSHQDREEFFVSRSGNWFVDSGLDGVAPAVQIVPIRPEALRPRQTDGVLLVAGVERFEDGDRTIVRDIANLLTGTVKDELRYKRESQLATRDVLTGVPNRRLILRRAAGWFSLAVRYDRSFALGLFDVDHFKAINDTYGHACGDLALRHLAEVIGSCLRDVDVLARYGGEEFMILFPETTLEGARQSAERVRRSVEANPLLWKGEVVSMTISGGVVAFGENSRYFNGRLYRVCRPGDELILQIEEKKIPLGLRSRAIPERDGLTSVLVSKLGLARDALELRTILDMIEQLVSLGGLIRIADSRLYRSKEEGRNRVTNGPW